MFLYDAFILNLEFKFDQNCLIKILKPVSKVNNIPKSFQTFPKKRTEIFLFIQKLFIFEEVHSKQEYFGQFWHITTIKTGYFNLNYCRDFKCIWFCFCYLFPFSYHLISRSFVHMKYLVNILIRLQHL